MADEQSALQRAWSTVKKYAAKVWSYLKVAKMEYIVMASLFALDLISKAIVNATTKVGDTVVLIPYFLNVHNIHNYDAAFGSEWMTNALGSMGSRILFSIFAVIASVIFIFILIRNKGGNRLLRVSFAMLVAGALGNCVDRMFLGYVRDFVEFVYFGLTIGGHDSFYVFNIADAELVIGVILVLIYFIFMYRDKPEDKKAVVTADDESVERTAEVSDGAADAEGEKEADSSSEDVDKEADGAAADVSSENEENKVDDASPEFEEKSPSEPAEETAAADEVRTVQEPMAVDKHEDEPSTAQAVPSEAEAEPVAQKPTARRSTAVTAPKTTARKTAARTAPKSSAAGKTTVRKTTARTAGATVKKSRVKAEQDKSDGEATTE